MARRKARTPPWLVRYCTERVGGEQAVEELRKMYQEGAKISEIMEKFGLRSPQCVYALLDEPMRRGRYKPKTKITDEIVERVLKLRAQNYTIPRIAKELNISVGSVHKILKEKGLTG